MIYKATPFFKNLRFSRDVRKKFPDSKRLKKVDFSKSDTGQASFSVRLLSRTLQPNMAALPIAACGGPLKYGVVRSPTHHYAFMAVTVNGYCYRLEQQGTAAKPKMGFRCRSPKCAAWVKVDGLCEHKKACLGRKEPAIS